MYTLTHTLSHTHTHAYTHTLIHTHIHTRLHTHTHAYTYTHAHTLIHTHMHTHTGTELGGAYITGTTLQPCCPSTFTTPAIGTQLVLLTTTPTAQDAQEDSPAKHTAKVTQHQHLQGEAVLQTKYNEPSSALQPGLPHPPTLSSSSTTTTTTTAASTATHVPKDIGSMAAKSSKADTYMLSPHSFQQYHHVQVCVCVCVCVCMCVCVCSGGCKEAVGGHVYVGFLVVFCCALVVSLLCPCCVLVVSLLCCVTLVNGRGCVGVGGGGCYNVYNIDEYDNNDIDKYKFGFKCGCGGT